MIKYVHFNFYRNTLKKVILFNNEVCLNKHEFNKNTPFHFTHNIGTYTNCIFVLVFSIWTILSMRWTAGCLFIFFLRETRIARSVPIETVIIIRPESENRTRLLKLWLPTAYGYWSWHFENCCHFVKYGKYLQTEQKCCRASWILNEKSIIYE